MGYNKNMAEEEAVRGLEQDFQEARENERMDAEPSEEDEAGLAQASAEEDAIERFEEAVEDAKKETMCVCGDEQETHVDGEAQCAVPECGCKEFDDGKP